MTDLQTNANTATGGPHHTTFFPFSYGVRTAGAGLCQDVRSTQGLTARPLWRNDMRNHFDTVVVAGAIAIACMTSGASAQAPAQSAAQPSVSTAVASPTYVSIPLEIAVNRPAAEVWKRVGKFCDIGEWLRIPCTITSGK